MTRYYHTIQYQHSQLKRKNKKYNVSGFTLVLIHTVYRQTQTIVHICYNSRKILEKRIGIQFYFLLKEDIFFKKAQE